MITCHCCGALLVSDGLTWTCPVAKLDVNSYIHGNHQPPHIVDKRVTLNGGKIQNC